MILPPSGVADMMGSLFFYGMGGQDAEDGRTVFSAGAMAGRRWRVAAAGRAAGPGSAIGSPTCPSPSTAIRSNPGSSASPSSPAARRTRSPPSSTTRCPWSAPTGSATGSLAHLRYHRAGAAHSGVDPAPYIDNLILRADGRWRDGGGTVDEMVARTERGLLLTCLWYIREVDPATALLTGLTRDGVYVIEDGAVVGAANNFRFNESPVDLLARATEVGTSVRTLGRELGEYLNRCIMPPLRIPDFNMSSVSQAS